MLVGKQVEQEITQAKQLSLIKVYP